MTTQKLASPKNTWADLNSFLLISPQNRLHIASRTQHTVLPVNPATLLQPLTCPGSKQILLQKFVTTLVAMFRKQINMVIMEQVLNFQEYNIDLNQFHNWMKRISKKVVYVNLPST